MTTDESTPAQLIEQGDTLWATLWATLWPAISEGDDAALLTPGAAGDWSARDVLMHIAHWQEHAVERLTTHLAGREPVSLDDYEAWNARWHTEDSDAPPTEARNRCEQSRTALRTFLGSLEDSQWDERVRGIAAGLVNEHYQEHLDFLAERTG